MGAQAILKALEDDAKTDFEHYHVPQVAKQFLAGYVTVLFGSLASAGWHVAGWAALWSLLGGAALATVEKLWPTLPWAAFLKLIRQAQDDVQPPAPPAAPPHG